MAVQNPKVIVKRQPKSKQFGIFAIHADGREELLEGGFFDPEFAKKCAEEYQDPAVIEVVREAESERG